jgi:hypothetical protein
MTEAVEDSDPKDNRFNPSRLPATAKMQGLVDEIRRQLLSYEAKFQPRKKRRREVDQERFDRIVKAIVCDLVHGSLKDPRAWRHISLSKQRSGSAAVGAPFMTEARIGIIEWMAKPEMDWLELKKAAQIRNPFGGQQSTIRASRRLQRYVEDREIGLEDFGRDPTLMGDPIVLKDHKVKGKAKALSVPPGEPADTYRAEMEIINAALAHAEIACDDVDKQGNERDAGDRWLRRIFNNGSLEQGGRLYGGFWQAMSTENRLRDLRLCGEPVASLDFGQCGIRIAYGHVGAQPPPGDLYDVPGLEGYREGVKAILNAQLAKTKGMKRKPMGTAKHFSKHLSIREIEQPIVHHHQPIRELFYSGFGLTMQFIESRVLVHSLLRLIDLRVVALPVHDCLVVPQSSAEIAEQVMLDSFQLIAGVPGVVGRSVTPS